MPVSPLYRAGKAMFDGYKNSAKGSDPEIPVPGRTPSQTQAAQTQAAPMSNKAKVNRAADVLHVPGRDVIRKGMNRRQKMLDEI